MAIAFRAGQALCAILALALAGCGSTPDAAVEVVAIGPAGSQFEAGPRLPLPAQLVRGATAEGLVSLDAQGRVIPALAERWIVTDDGRSYIFRLRDGTWPDGSPITGQAARAALREALAALRGTPLALDLAGIEEIRAMTGRVIEIRLARSNPDLLQLLAQPELGLARKGRGGGPMRLTRASDAALLTPIPPEERGLPPIDRWRERHRQVRLVALPAQAAVDRFNRGEADMVLGGRLDSFPLAGAMGLSRGTIQMDPVAGLFGLAVVHAGGFLAEPANREAIALAVDRDALMVPFGVGGWTATTRIVAPGNPGDTGTVVERWPGLSIGQRRARARERVTAWHAAHPGPLRLRIALPAGIGGTMLFARLRDDLGQVGITAERAGEADAADLRLLDAVARYAGASWYLNQLSCAAQRVCSESADALVSAARAAPSEAERADLLAEAEATLTAANVFIPFGAPIRWSLVRGEAAGFAANRWGVHPLMPMAARPK